MSLFDVTFLTTDGGLGRTLAGDDAISGLVITGTAPAGKAKTFAVYSVKDAEGAGITATAYPELHYHVTNFYARVAAPLFVTFSTGDEAQDFEDLQNEAEGAIRQVAVIGTDEFTLAQVTALNTAAAVQATAHRGFSVLFAPYFQGADTLAGLPSLTSLSAPLVSVVIGQDQNSVFSCVGDTLGTVALAKVSECIGWVKKFNSNTGTSFDRLAFATGETYKSVADTLKNSTTDKGYLFLRKYTGQTGSFYSDSKTATSSTSDFSTIENVRSMEKAQRVVRAALVPELGSPLKTKGGLLSLETIVKFELLVQNPLEAMVDAGELSEFSIFIDPTQKVLGTSKLEIQVGLTPLGVARQIVVPIGFQVKASN